MIVLFLDRALWLHVASNVPLARLVEIEEALAPVVRDRLIDMVRARLGMDEDAT